MVPKVYPPTQKVTVFETVGECIEGTLRSSYERSRVCFGGFRPAKHVEEPRASARGGFHLAVVIQVYGKEMVPIRELTFRTRACWSGV
jgi:hypothetical protein